MSKPKYVTVVYEIRDDDFYSEFLEDAKESMSSDDVNKVLAVSLDNEITRLELIEQVLEDCNLHSTEQIVSIDEILSLHSENGDIQEMGIEVINSWQDE